MSIVGPPRRDTVQIFSQLVVTFLSALPQTGLQTYQHPHHVCPEFGKTVRHRAVRLGFYEGGCLVALALHKVYGYEDLPFAHF